jgi:two-component system sensor histidine kinase MprB
VSLRTRLTLAAGGAVFVALAIASAVIFLSVRSKLHDQIDVSLVQTAEGVATKWVLANGPGHPGADLRPPPPKLPPGIYVKDGGKAGGSGTSFLGGGPGGNYQVIPSLAAALKAQRAGASIPAAVLKRIAVTNPKPGASVPPKAGSVEVVPGTTLLEPDGFVPLTAQDGAVAAGLSPPYFHDVGYGGVALRVYTMRLASTGDGLVRASRPLTETNATLARVRWLLIGLTLGGALAAALLGRLAANAVLRPVSSLAAAVRDVTATRELDKRLPVGPHDELGSLAEDFNAMLAALEESQRAQQQLIADASHELRTPLTAHRANVELLARPDLPPARRPQVLGAAVRGIEELSTLVGDLIEAARNGRSPDARSEVALDELVRDGVARAKRRAPTVRIESRIEPYTVVGAAKRLERAVDNVLDNALKWSPPGGTVTVTLAKGVLTVRDHGPGIDPADLPHVFDRFYRAASARGLPGSGLGLAIVKQTVDDHDGSLVLENADGGGVEVTLRFDRPA